MPAERCIGQNLTSKMQQCLKKFLSKYLTPSHYLLRDILKTTPVQNFVAIQNV